MNSNSAQEAFPEHLLCSRAWSVSNGDMSQTRQKSSSSESGLSSKGASKLQSWVNGVKPGRRVKGGQEGFSGEVLWKQTLTGRGGSQAGVWGKYARRKEELMHRPR